MMPPTAAPPTMPIGWPPVTTAPTAAPVPAPISVPLSVFDMPAHALRPVVRTMTPMILMVFMSVPLRVCVQYFGMLALVRLRMARRPQGVCASAHIVRNAQSTNYNPRMRPGTKRLLNVFYLRLGGCAVVGALWGGAVGASVLQPPLLGSVVAALAGALYAALLMGILGSAEMFLPRTRFGRALDRAPLIANIALKTIVYSAVIILMIGNRLG